MHSPCLPPTVHDPAPPSLRRVQREAVPLFHGYYEVLRRPASLAPRFVAFAWRYPASRPDLSLPSVQVARPRAWGSSAGPRSRLVSQGDVQGLPGSWGTPLCLRPVLGPRQDRRHQATYGGSAWPPFTTRRRLPHCGNFGAQWHGLGTCCLRFALWVAHTGRKTRCWLRARLYQAGLVTRRVPSKGFQEVFVTSSPPFPSLSWRRLRPRLRVHVQNPIASRRWQYSATQQPQATARHTSSFAVSRLSSDWALPTVCISIAGGIWRRHPAGKCLATWDRRPPVERCPATTGRAVDSG